MKWKSGICPNNHPLPKANWLWGIRKRTTQRSRIPTWKTSSWTANLCPSRSSTQPARFSYSHLFSSFLCIAPLIPTLFFFSHSANIAIPRKQTLKFGQITLSLPPPSEVNWPIPFSDRTHFFPWLDCNVNCFRTSFKLWTVLGPVSECHFKLLQICYLLHLRLLNNWQVLDIIGSRAIGFCFTFTSIFVVAQHIGISSYMFFCLCILVYWYISILGSPHVCSLFTKV